MKRSWIDAQTTLTVAVRGIQAGGYDISHCLDGDRVELVPEPTNEYDPHAIRIDAMTGETLGYVPADYAAVMDAREWSAVIAAVLPHPTTGVPAGLRLTLRRRETTEANRQASTTDNRGEGRKLWGCAASRSTGSTAVAGGSGVSAGSSMPRWPMG
jgi:HIRAN domain-containing protein